MAWFSRKSEAPPAAWCDLAPDETRSRVVALLGLALAALDSAQELTLSPASRPSKAFAREAIQAGEIARSPANLRELQAARERLLAQAATLGQWQRDSLDELQRELGEGLQEVAGMLRETLREDGNLAGEVLALGERLTRADRTDDLELLRKLVRQELQRTLEVARTQVASQRDLRTRLDSTVLDMEQRLDTMRETGSIDHLTRLANRAALDFYLEAMCAKVRAGSVYALTMLDLDDFKDVNDRHGHATGDRALNLVAAVLKQTLPERAFLARFGGDEFCAVLAGSPEELTGLLARTSRVLATTPLHTEAGPVRLRFSFGVAGVTGSPEASLEAADQALYRSKRERKNRAA